MRVGQIVGLSSRGVLLHVVPEDVEVLAVLCAADIGLERFIFGDAEDVRHGLLHFLILAELRGVGGQVLGGNYRAALVVELLDLLGCRRRKNIAGGQNQDLVLFTVLPCC